MEISPSPLKHWLCNDNKNNTWGWQCIVDALAIGENVPLQLVQITRLRNLYYETHSLVRSAHKDSCCDLGRKFLHLFPTENEWNHHVAIITKWAESMGMAATNQKHTGNIQLDQDSMVIIDLIAVIYPRLATRLFPTLPANPFPVDMMARMVLPEWQAFSLVWLHSWVTLQENLYPNKKYIYTNKALGCQTLQLAAHWIETTVCTLEESEGNCPTLKHQWLLLAGPAFGGEVPLLAESRYDTEVILPAVKFLEYFFSATSRHKPFRSHRFHRAAHAATPLPLAELDQRLTRIIRAIPTIMECDVASLYGDPTHHDLRQLSLWCLYTVQLSKKLDKLLMGNRQLILRHDKDYTEKDNKDCRNISKSLAPHPDVCFYAYKDDCDDLISVAIRQSTDEELSRHDGDHYGFEMWVSEKGVDEADLEYINTQLNQLCLRAYQKSRLLDSTRLLLISDWLQGEINVLGSHVSVNLCARFDTYTSRGISQWVNGLMRSEFTSLYRYDSSNCKYGVLQAIDSGYFHNKRNRSLGSLNADNMEHVAGDSILRNRSIAYRAMRDNRSKICLAYDQKTDKAIPAGETLFFADSTTRRGQPFKSVIAAPIRFNGRLQGLIEVGACDNWHFRWGQQILLEQAAGVIAPFLFHKRYQECLQEIERNMLKFYDGQIEDTELYAYICKSLSSLFLCDGASIWVRDSVEKHLLIREGNHNISRDKHFAIDLTKTNSPGAEVILAREDNKSNSPFDRIAISNLPESDELKKQGVNQMVLLPLIEPRDEGEPTIHVMAAISLYTRDEIGFDLAWSSIMDFMAGYLALVVKAIDAFIIRKRTPNIIGHTISQDVNTLTYICKKLAQEKHGLRDGIEQVLKLAKQPWFQDKLGNANIMGHWSNNQIQMINLLPHEINEAWFLPQNDINHQAEVLQTRASAILNRGRVGGDNEVNELRLAMGDEDAVELVNLEEKEEPFCLIASFNKLCEVNHGIARKGLYVDLSEINIDYTPIARSGVIETVLQNIIDNAVKYSNDNTSLTIKTESLAEGGLKLSIINNGPSMKSSNEYRRVTRNGFRGSNVSNVTGAGAGLYIVKLLCQHVLRFDFQFTEVPIAYTNNSEYYSTLCIPTSRVKRKYE